MRTDELKQLKNEAEAIKELGLPKESKFLGWILQKKGKSDFYIGSKDGADYYTSNPNDAQKYNHPQEIFKKAKKLECNVVGLWSLGDGKFIFHFIE